MVGRKVQRNVRLCGDLDKTFVEFCTAASRRPNDVIDAALRMLLEGGEEAAEARLTAALHGHEEWPVPNNP